MSTQALEQTSTGTPAEGRLVFDPIPAAELQQIRAAVQHLRDHGTEDLAQVTLMSDGVSVYEFTSPDEVVDLLAGGQGVFGIALGRVWQEVAGELAELPAVRAEDGLIAGGNDELANRRARKTG